MSKFDIKKYLHENRITVNNGFDIHAYVKGTVMEDVVNDVIDGKFGPKMKTELRRISSAKQIHEWANVNFSDVVNPKKPQIVSETKDSITVKKSELEKMVQEMVDKKLKETKK